MRTTFVLIVAVLSLAGLNSCKKLSGEGPLTTEIRDTGPFTAVVSEISGSVEVYPGSGPQVEVSAQGNIQDILETRVTGGVLHLYFRRSVHLASYTPIRVVIHVPVLSLVAVQGSASMRVSGLRTDALGLSVSGSGILYTDSVMISGPLNIDLSGSGSIRMAYLEALQGNLTLGGSGNIMADEGKVKTVHIALSGSGNVDFGGLSTTDAEVHESGSGDTGLGTTKTLVAYVSGSGNIYYRGTADVAAHISGSGKIKSW
jgi:hypothetical protein